MTERPPVDGLREQQRAWARNLSIDLDRDGYCTRLEQNLFQPLSAGCRSEFECGDGSELGKPGTRGKIQALHSSAALAYNVFDYWRGWDLDVLGRALGFPGELCEITFEQKFPTGLGGIAPNVDVALQRSNGGVLAIESKFTEPYAISKLKCYLKPKYFLERRRFVGRSRASRLPSGSRGSA